jgi:hypothetical protein
MLISSEIGVNFLIAWIRHHTDGVTGVVDMGAGTFNKLGFVSRDCWQRRCGIEIHQPALDAATEPDVQKLLGNFLDYPAFVNPAEFPCAMFIDTIEHVEYDDGHSVLRGCQDDFQRILVMTPDGHNPQDAVDGNDYQKHLSTWHPDDFQELGFQLILTYPFFHPPGKGTTGAIFARWDKE